MGDLVETVASFRGKRVLVTGDTGFKGSWLVLWLLEAGADVYGYALPAENDNDHFNLLDLKERIQHEDGDIRDREQIGAFFRQAQPEHVFHMAAQALVRQSYDDPKETFDINVGGAVNLLECVRETPSVRTLVYVTSDKCYLNKEWVWGYREDDELGGHDPYSASKAAAELVLSAYGDSFFRTRSEGFGYASVRAGNVIGGGDWAEDRVVPDCLRALRDENPVVLRNPTATRPWQHVLDPLSGYLMLAHSLTRDPQQFSGAWNFGPDGKSSRSVQDLAEAIVSCWGSGEIETRSSADEPHEAGFLHLNCDKAHRVLGWRSRWGFRLMVAETVDWYRKVLSGQHVRKLSCDQIKRYMETTVD
jgi:CDP-glucose 4,6-dehydratase